MSKPIFTDLVPPERQRTYIFANGEKVSYKNVTRIAISTSGTHRLELASGLKIIVPFKWLAVELDMDDWTF